MRMVCTGVSRWRHNLPVESSSSLLPSLSPWGGDTVPGPHSGPAVITGCVCSCAHARSPRAMASSAACWRFSATWAAMMRWRSAIKLHFWHAQSLNLQWRLCPFSQETIPWFRHLAHFGFREPFSVNGYRVTGFIFGSGIAKIVLCWNTWGNVFQLCTKHQNINQRGPYSTQRMVYNSFDSKSLIS